MLELSQHDFNMLMVVVALFSVGGVLFFGPLPFDRWQRRSHR